MPSKSFRYERRVEFGETDMAGIVHFSNFFRYMEAAETAFLTSLGYSVSWESAEGRFGFPRVRVSCEYHAPARFADLLTIELCIEKLGTKSITYRHTFFAHERKIATGQIVSVLCQHSASHGMTSLDIPQALRAALKAYMIPKMNDSEGTNAC